MALIEAAVIFAISLLVMAKTSSMAVKYAVKFSKLSGLNMIAVGFLILAISTSLPEIVVTIIATLKGQGMLGFSTGIGSSIGDLSIILGVAALAGFTVPKKDRQDITAALAIGFIISIFVLVLGGTGIAFGIFAFIVFFSYMNLIIKDGVEIKNNRVHGLKSVALVKSCAYTIISALIVAVSAYFLVSSAADISRIAGLDEAFIGSVVIAFGAFMPELSLTIVAMRKRNVELALGDIAGSIVTNIALIGGIASLGGIAVDPVFSAVILFLMSYMAIAFLMLHRNVFGKKEGILLICMYFFFVAAMLMIAG